MVRRAAPESFGTRRIPRHPSGTGDSDRDEITGKLARSSRQDFHRQIFLAQSSNGTRRRSIGRQARARASSLVRKSGCLGRATMRSEAVRSWVGVIFRRLAEKISVAFRSSASGDVAMAVWSCAGLAHSCNRFSTFFSRAWRKPCSARLSRHWSNVDQISFGRMDVQLKDAAKSRRPHRVVVPGGSRPVGPVDFMIEIN